MTLRAIFALLCAGVAGCAATQWAHPNGNDFGVDSGQCQAQAYSAGSGAAPRQLIYNSCMQGKGWQRQG